MPIRLAPLFRDVATVVQFVVNHPANRGARIRAIIRAVRFQIRGRTGRSTITPIGRNSRIWADLHYTASSKALYGNPPDWSEMQAWRSLLRSGDVFVDVGSNVGSYALWAADCGADVIAIEPSPDARAKLQKNVALNPGVPITILDCGLADSPGTMLLTEGLGTINHVVFGDYRGEARAVTMRTLDDVLDGGIARGVKVDVEGAERLVLEGARASLGAGRIGVLQLEWNSMSEHVLGEDRSSVATLLAGYGYSLFRPDRTGRLCPTVDVSYGDDVFAARPSTLIDGDAQNP